MRRHDRAPACRGPSCRLQSQDLREPSFGEPSLPNRDICIPPGFLRIATFFKSQLTQFDYLDIGIEST